MGDVATDTLLEASAEKIEHGESGGPGKKGKNEILYFALRNGKVRVGLVVVGLFLLIAIAGPWFARHEPFGYNSGAGGIAPNEQFWMGTTYQTQDVYSQFVHSLRAAFIVGGLSGSIATLIGMVIGFVSGYRGGWVDDLLSGVTNVVLTIPAIAVLIIIAAYLEVRSVFTQSLLIGILNWPWVARAVRAQTFSLRNRDFVDLARMSSVPALKIIFREIAPNMYSYLLMVLILQFGGTILTAATLDFLGLGPTNAISLGIMMSQAVEWNALQFGLWWWFIPPGLAITCIVGALYITNVGLDEVFNPRLRET
ncbi:MAG: ABC transporter permease [Spirochaetota bacterium]